MSAPLMPADRWGERLTRRLGLWSAVAVLVGSTIGSGIFRTPARIAAYVPAPVPMFGVWVLGGLLALCGALTYAELAAMYPRSGGVYVYVREGFGRLPAFLFGWTELLLIRASALGAIATPFAEYLMRSLGYDPKIAPNATYVHYVAAGAIILTATLNYVGVRWSSLVLNLTTGAKYGALVLLVLLAFLVGQGDFGHFSRVAGGAGVPPRPCRGGGGPRRRGRGGGGGGGGGGSPVRVLRAGARLGSLGLRWVGRPLVRGRRGARPRAQHAARPRAGYAERDRDLPAGERRVPVSHSHRPDGASAPRRGRRRAADRGAGRRRPRGGPGDARHVQHVGGVDLHLAPHLLRHGGRRLAVPPGGPSASALSHAVGLDRRDRGARRRVGAAAQLRPAGRPVRGRDFPLLCPCRGGGLRVAVAPARAAPACEGAGVPRRTAAVYPRHVDHPGKRTP